MNYSKKRKKQVQQYNKLRIQFLTDNNICKKCGGRASTIHHAKGRIGELLLNQKYWIPLCFNCHVWVEEHPAEAKEKGYSLSRLAKD